jgi:hypothetical protein
MVLQSWKEIIPCKKRCLGLRAAAFNEFFYLLDDQLSSRGGED